MSLQHVYLCVSDSGVGAGIDSYYEYLLKAYILLGDDQFLQRFNIVRERTNTDKSNLSPLTTLCNSGNDSGIVILLYCNTFSHFTFSLALCIYNEVH